MPGLTQLTQIVRLRHLLRNLGLNYMKLNVGFSGFRNSVGNTFDINYKDIGMHTYSPGFAIALSARYKKLSLEFAGSGGSYDGSFITPADMVRDDMQIDSGSVVSGTVDTRMNAFSEILLWYKNSMI